MEIRGWLFDLYPLESSMILWIKGEDGSLRRFEDPFRPRFYARGNQKDLLSLFHSLEKEGRTAGYQWTQKREFWSGDEVEVMEIELGNPEHYAQISQILPRWEERVTFYNCDIPTAQAYLYAKRLFPTGSCIAETEGNRVFEIRPDPSESVWVGDGDLPDLRVMELRTLNQSCVSMARGRYGSGLILECEGYRWEMEHVDPGEIEKFIKQFDPDVILSDNGDACLLPLLFSLERKLKISIPWDREPYRVERGVNVRGHSYFSYGRIYYKAPGHLFLGRWHIDRRNSFIYGESGIEGVIELARLAKIPIQRMARTSPGTAITSMQLDRAFQEGILIPWRKGEPERFKTAWDLLVADKGGLVFQPKLGIFENVAEIDFASMYPTIMAIHNISPETVFCRCCENPKVPEAGYTLCEKREGIVPKTLRPILTRRAWLKKRMKELEFGVEKGNAEESRMQKAESSESEAKKREIYDQKQTALKWMLVTCFGYLGYRNARFGRIEAHEAVTAFGREKLLQAKELCEEEGFELLHAITDSLWIRKKNLKEEEVLELCRKISQATGITMSLEGIYRWMTFLPSRGNPESPVANRYFGLFENGKIKARGLAFRRGDMPPFIQEAQIRMLEILAEAKDKSDYQSRIPKILDIFLEYSLMLKDGRTRQEDLAIGKRISQEPNAYKVDSLTALAAQQLEDFGIPIHPGEKVRYMIKDALSKDKDERVRAFPLVSPDDTYDVKKYLELLLKATEELLIHLGYDAKHLRKILAGKCPASPAF